MMINIILLKNTKNIDYPKLILCHSYFIIKNILLSQAKQGISAKIIFFTITDYQKIKTDKLN